MLFIMSHMKAFGRTFKIGHGKKISGHRLLRLHDRTKDAYTKLFGLYHITDLHLVIHKLIIQAPTIFKWQNSTLLFMSAS